jgi:hypothetical protein
LGQNLNHYLADASTLLRDWGFQFTTQQRLIRWVNAGRQQTAKLSGCLRTLVPGTAPLGANANPGTMTPGSFAPGVAPDAGFNARLNTERYAFAFGNPYLKAQNAGYAAINDVFNVALNWGGTRPVLRWMPWDDLQAYARAYTTLTSSFPLIWSTLGAGTSGQVWLWPPPSQTMEMEWDCTCLPSALNTSDDFDALPDSFTSGVKYYAAGMAYLSSYRPGLAENMFKLFLGHVTQDMGASEGGKVPDYYYTSLAMS